MTCPEDERKASSRVLLPSFLCVVRSPPAGELVLQRVLGPKWPRTSAPTLLA